MRGASLILPFLALLSALPACSEGPSGAEVLAAGPLPVLGEIAPFGLVDQSGAVFGREELAGRVWVADFFFTRCPSICPQLTRHLQRVADRWRKVPRIGFLSISVDPTYDTPEVLEAHRREWPMAKRWTLLTGDPAAIRSLSLDSFHLAFDGDFSQDGDITHSTRFVLVDPEARIRGYFNTLDEGFEEELDLALARLLAEQDAAQPGPAPAAAGDGSASEAAG